MYTPDPPNTSSNNTAEPEPPGHSSAKNSEWKSLSQLDWNYKKYKAAEEGRAGEETAPEQTPATHNNIDSLPNLGHLRTFENWFHTNSRLS
jgi:hypothetical protein